jgi:Flp pilus assembly protein TadD
MTLMLIRQLRGKLLARRGDFEEAERLAREAVTLSQGDEDPLHHGDALFDLALVLIAVGKVKEALEALAQAHSSYSKKGHTVGAGRVEDLRAELGATLEA